MAKKHMKQVFRYKCTITEEEFKTTRKAPNPDELVSVSAYYQLHPDQDDRPERIKIEQKQIEEAAKAGGDLFAALQAGATSSDASEE